jgi:hypothetical protein
LALYSWQKHELLSKVCELDKAISMACASLSDLSGKDDIVRQTLKDMSVAKWRELYGPYEEPTNVHAPSGIL